MSGFNPYREWLGLETDDRPTYYELLGLARSNDAPGRPLNGLEREHVNVTAARQLEQLRQLDPGPHSALRDQLAKRLARARDTLTDDQLRRDYDRRLLQEEAASLARKQVPQPAPGGDIESPPLSPPSVDEDRSELWKPARPRVVLGRKMRRQKRRQRTRWATAALLVVSLLGLAYLAVAQQHRWLAQGEADVPSAPTSETPAVPATSVNVPRERTSTSPVAPPVERPAQPPVTTLPNVPSTPKPMPVDPSPAPTAEQEASRLGLWRDAVRQLDANTLSEASASLELSAALPMDEAARQRQRRLARLVDYVDRYWSAADRALASLKSGDEFELQGKPVIVVERTDDRLVLRSAGRNVTFEREQIPPNLARAFAERWFDQNAASTLVFRGAMLAVAARTETQRQEVRRLWAQANASGEVDLGDLPLVLDDLAALRQP